MKKAARSLLLSLLTGSAPVRRLPARVVQQLVGYYGDFRRSRDIMNELDDALNAPLVSRFFKRSPIGSSNPLRTP